MRHFSNLVFACCYWFVLKNAWKRVIWNEIRYLFAKPKDINRTTSEIDEKKTPLFPFSYWIFAVTNRLFVTFFCKRLYKKKLGIFCIVPLRLPLVSTVMDLIYYNWLANGLSGFSDNNAKCTYIYLFSIQTLECAEKRYLTLTLDKEISHFRPCGHCSCFLFFSFCR